MIHDPLMGHEYIHLPHLSPSKIHDRPSQQEVVPRAGGQEGTSLFANRDEGGRLVPPPCATREVGLREEVSLRPFARKPIQLCRKAGELFSHQEVRTAEPDPRHPRPRQPCEGRVGGGGRGRRQEGRRPPSPRGGGAPQPTPPPPPPPAPFVTSALV